MMMIPVALAAAAIAFAAPAHAEADWRRVDQALGRGGVDQADQIRRYSFPRSDLNVKLDGVTIKPALALGSWLAFREAGNHAEVMGDLVLRHEEINPVLSRLLEGGLTITALHNHLLRSDPATMYMHIHGHGDPAELARTIKAALALSATPMTPSPANGDPPLAMDTGAIDRIMGIKGKASGGVYHFSIPRAEEIVDGGNRVPPTMGLGTAINFQPTGSGKAAITGDFVLTAPEVTSVLKALRQNDIEVTALHNHLTGEEPRLFFMHFWANADAKALAKGLRQALDQMNLKDDRPTATR